MRGKGWRIAGVWLVAATVTAPADTVTLKSGAVIRGEIVGEDAYEVRIVVGRTVAGDIQTQKVVAQSSVASLERSSPEVAVEADPGAAEGKVEAPEPLPDAAALRRVVKRADESSSEGKYVDAVTDYRAVIEEAERRLALPADAADPATQAARLELLQIRADAYVYLLIALRGKLDLKRETLRAADGLVKDQERTLKDQRKELDGLKKPKKDDPEGKVRRIGEDSVRAADVARKRTLEDEIASGETRLKSRRAWARDEQLELVNLEGEIELMEAKEGTAKDALKAAERAARSKR